jgi:hypothetical protein
MPAVIIMEPDDLLSRKSRSLGFVKRLVRAEIDCLSVDSDLGNPPFVDWVQVDSHDSRLVIAEESLISALRNGARLTQIGNSVVVSDAVDVVNLQIGVLSGVGDPRKTMRQPLIAVQPDPDVSTGPAECCGKVSGGWASALVQLGEKPSFGVIIEAFQDFFSGRVRFHGFLVRCF